MAHPLWPLFDLRLTTPDLELRLLTEPDLPAFGAVIPDDLEMNPKAHRFTGFGDRQQRQVIAAQGYWKALGTWTPDSWALWLAVRHDGSLIGFQGLEGDDFPTLRTVDSSSFLAEDARGRGWGKQMRQAVLALAFGALGAEYAITSAWHDNHASLGVSRALGYVDNGVQRHRRDALDGSRSWVDDMVHLRLTQAEFVRRHGFDGVTVSGAEACLPLFGL